MRAVIEPCGRVSGLHLTTCPELTTAGGFSAVSGLPDGVARRQAKRLAYRLKKEDIESHIPLEEWAGAANPGTVAAVVFRQAPVPTLFVGLGERGKPAESVADDAADEAIRYRDAKAPVDPHSADQLLLPLVFSPDASEYRTSEITRHLTTNIDTIRRFVDREIGLDGREGEPGTGADCRRGGGPRGIIGTCPRPSPNRRSCRSRRSSRVPRPRGRGSGSPSGSRAARSAARGAATRSSCRSRAVRRGPLPHSPSRWPPPASKGSPCSAASRSPTRPGRRELAGEARRLGLSVMAFTGYTLEHLRESPDAAVADLLARTDILVDGPYLRDQLDTERRWVGSRNQRIHFLTDRYRFDDSWRRRNTLEIRMSGGEITVNGFPARDAVGLWKGWGRRPKPVAPAGGETR